MIFNPLGLLALLAIPVIVGIHLFRRRYQPLVVTGLFLYGAAALAPTSGRRRERLRRRTSLLLELLAALAATWFLCDPHWDAADQGTHHVFLLDSRRSLEAVDADGTAAGDRARAAVLARLDGMRSVDRVTVIASGEPPRVLAGPSERIDPARAALTAWRYDQPWHELDAGVALAVALGAGGTTTVVSDRLPPGLPGDLGVLAVGAARPSVGFTAARWLRDGSGERLALQLLAQGADAERTVLVQADDQVVLRQTVQLRDRIAQAITVPIPADWTATTVTIALLEPDPYAADDRLLLHRPASRTIGWRLEALPESTANAVRRALAAIDGAIEGTANAHLVIAEESVPSAGQWSVTVRPGEADPVMGPFLARRGDSVLADIDATGVLWSGGTRAAAGEALLLAGEALLLTAQRDGRDRHLHLWCDLDRSTLAAHPAWPALWANIIAARADMLPGVRDPNVPCGVAVRLVLPPGHDRLTIIGPDDESGELRADGDGVVIHPGLRRSGSHEIHLTGLPTPWLTLHAQVIDARLADLMAAEPLIRESIGTGIAERERRRGPLAHLLPVLILAAGALGAWLAFTREQPHTRPGVP